MAKTTEGAKGERAKKSAQPSKSAVAFVVRTSKEALQYLREIAGEEPVTRVLRRILAKGDPKLEKLLGEE